MPEFPLGMTGGTRYSRGKVPVDFLDGVHWRPSVMGDELMSFGWTSPYRRLLSPITIAQFADLDYQVNFLAAEHYVLPRASSGQADPDRRPQLWLGQASHPAG